MIQRAVLTTWKTRNKVCFKRDVVNRMISVMGRMRQAEHIVRRRIAPLDCSEKRSSVSGESFGKESRSW